MKSLCHFIERPDMSKSPLPRWSQDRGYLATSAYAGLRHALIFSRESDGSNRNRSNNMEENELDNSPQNSASITSGNEDTNNNMV